MRPFVPGDWLAGANVGAWGFLALHAVTTGLPAWMVALDLVVVSVFGVASVMRWRRWL